jgi:outer membrane protein OmpA-like peptidoglycan-associated protein
VVRHAIEREQGKIKMKTLLFAILPMVVLAACSSASGPTFNAYQVNPQGGQPTYRVECHGLLEGQGVCQDKAREICGDQVVRPIEPVTPYGKEVDVRTLTFQCGAPLANPVEQPAAKPVAQPTPAVGPVTVKRLDLSGDANFETDKAVLTPVAKRKLDALLAETGGQSFRRVEVDGHTDARASVPHNLDLSDRRAQSVAEYLREHGLRSTVWDVRGHGKANPIDSNATAEGRARNRRVEVRLLQ